MNFNFCLLNDTLNRRESFDDQQIIRDILLISDVDGVIRHSVSEKADVNIMNSLQSLLKNNAFTKVVFISGTPVSIPESPDSWKNSNISLDKVFDGVFCDQMQDQKVAIYGVLGSHLLHPTEGLIVIDEYSLLESFTLSKLLIEAFLIECLYEGNFQQKAEAEILLSALNEVLLKNEKQPNNTCAIELDTIIWKIRQSLDPNFKLLNRGGLVETHTTTPPWKTKHSSVWLKEQVAKHPVLQTLTPLQKNIATGVAHQDDYAFNFLMVSKTNKGMTTENILSKAKKHMKNPLIITVGDTQVDFPMHQHAHIAFHVGSEQVFRDHALENCILVTDKEGNANQHVHGTLQVLQFIEQTCNQPYSYLIDSILKSSARLKGACFSSVK